jgi:hypothetical protein
VGASTEATASEGDVEGAAFDSAGADGAVSLPGADAGAAGLEAAGEQAVAARPTTMTAAPTRRRIQRLDMAE